LRLKLTGILSAAADDTLAGALIEGPDRETLYYRPGESLPGNATLKQVYPDRVVIDRSGRLENLYFPEEFNSPALASYQEPAQDESATYDYNQDQSGSSEPEEVSASQVGEARKASIKERLSKLRSRLMNNR
jgi:general secretion pathway protein C